MERLQKGIEEKAGNAILIKLNQIGTLSARRWTPLSWPRRTGIRPSSPHRSGETEDTLHRRPGGGGECRADQNRRPPAGRSVWQNITSFSAFPSVDRIPRQACRINTIKQLHGGREWVRKWNVWRPVCGIFGKRRGLSPIRLLCWAPAWAALPTTSRSKPWGYGEIEGFSRVHRQRSQGAFCPGLCGGKEPVAVMQGRVHYYEGYPMRDVVLPIRVMARLGAQADPHQCGRGDSSRLCRRSPDAAHRPYQFFCPFPLLGPNEEAFGLRFPDMSEVYSRKDCARWRKRKPGSWESR